MLSCKDNFATGEEFAICKCTKCGFAFTQDFPGEAIIGRYYESPEYISHTDTNKGIINRLYHIARSITLHSKSELIKSNTGRTTGRLLDVGCGTGYFLNCMNKTGWVAEGIEQSASVREQVGQHFGIQVKESSYLFEIKEKSFDAITMWHVLEHMEHLNEVMVALHKILNEKGMAFIALPNKNSYDAAHYRNNWAAYDVPRHLWHFSPEDFKELAHKHHFDLVAIKPMYFDSFYISMLSEKNKKTVLDSIVGLVKGGIFFLRSLFNTNRCSSVVYILKKQK